jgi:hypothetical protein
MSFFFTFLNLFPFGSFLWRRTEKAQQEMGNKVSISKDELESIQSESQRTLRAWSSCWTVCRMVMLAVHT